MPPNSFSNVRWLLYEIFPISLIILARTSYVATGGHAVGFDDNLGHAAEMDDDDDSPFSGSGINNDARATTKYRETPTTKYAYRTTTRPTTTSLEASTVEVQNLEQKEKNSTDRFSLPATTAIGVYAGCIAFIVTVVVGVLVIVVVVKRKQRLSRPKTRGRKAQTDNLCEDESCNSQE